MHLDKYTSVRSNQHSDTLAQEFHHYGAHIATSARFDTHSFSLLLFSDSRALLLHSHFCSLLFSGVSLSRSLSATIWMCVIFAVNSSFYGFPKKTDVVQMNLFMIPHENKHAANSTLVQFFFTFRRRSKWKVWKWSSTTQLTQKSNEILQCIRFLFRSVFTAVLAHIMMRIEFSNSSPHWAIDLLGKNETRENFASQKMRASKVINTVCVCVRFCNARIAIRSIEASK